MIFALLLNLFLSTQLTAYGTPSQETPKEINEGGNPDYIIIDDSGF